MSSYVVEVVKPYYVRLRHEGDDDSLIILSGAPLPAWLVDVDQLREGGICLVDLRIRPDLFSTNPGGV